MASFAGGLMRTYFFVVATAIAAAFSVPCLAQRSTPIRLLHPAGASGDEFGSGVAISGDTMIVCAKSDDVGPNANQGAAHVYRWNGTAWTFEATLVASDGEAGDYFGNDAVLSGDTAIVSAFLDDGVKGSAYVFTRTGSTWTQQAKLVAANGVANDAFGTCVALSGDTAIVGAPNAEAGRGAAYVFARSGATWTQQAQLLDPDGATEEQFGGAVSICGEAALVGNRFDVVGANLYQGSVTVFNRSGATWTRQAKLVASDGAASDFFGCSVALSGDTALVGAYGDSIAHIGQGSAYIFTRTGAAWSQQTKLIAPDAAPDDAFGFSVAISGDTALVGASFDDVVETSQGSAYVFSRVGSTWSQQTKLTAPDGAGSEYFGNEVHLSDDFAVAGLQADDIGASADQGSAWVFSRIGDKWIGPDLKCIAPDGATNDDFGVSVSISGQTALIGAYRDDVGANSNQGAAYVFVRSGLNWVQQAKLVASDGLANDNFGFSVFISGDTALVGAYLDDVGAISNQGSAYVFTRSGSTWTQQAKLTASDGAASDFFGYSVALAGSTALVGAYGDNIGANANQGSGYVFTRSGSVWTQQAKLSATDGAVEDRLGFAVALSGDTALLGAPTDDPGVNADQGSAYVFIRSGSAWSQQAKLTAADGAAGDSLGHSVALSGNTAILGAFADDVGANTGQGSAYIFQRTGSTWAQQAQLTASDGGANEFFGMSVAISGDTALVGASSDNEGANFDQGSAFVFTRAGSLWIEQVKLLAPDGASSDFFGGAVALADGNAIVGANGDDIAANSNQGSAWFFDVPYDDFRAVYNETFGVGYSNLSTAVTSAPSGSHILATETAFRFGGGVNTSSNTVAIRSSGDIHAPVERVFLLGGSSSLSVPVGRTISIFGPLSANAFASVNISGDSFLLGSRGTLTAGTGSSITIDGDVSSLEGRTSIQFGAAVVFSGSMTNIGPISALTGATLEAGGAITNIDLTQLTGADVTTPMYLNRASLICEQNCSFTGDFVNNVNATTLINSGSLLIGGTLTNNGIVAATLASPDITVHESLVQSASAGFIFPFNDSVVRVAGNFDAAINSNAAYALSLATLRLDGSGPEQTMEAMSKDIGATALGLDRVFPGHFPIGTLELASGSTVRLVDNHDNDTLGQGSCEAAYVNELRINSGARLINTGCAKIYYNTLINNGTVDVPANLIAIGTLPCSGDLNGDTQVDDSDFVLFASAYNILDCLDPFMPSGCPADLNADGVVDDTDFVLFVAAYDTLVCP